MLLRNMLAQLDMSSQQIDIYIQILKNGKTTASTIANQLNRERTSTFKMMRSMAESGWLSMTQDRYTSYFNAVDFSIIKDNFEKKLNQLQNIHNNMNKIEDEALSISNTQYGSLQINIYQGSKGLKSSYQKIYDIIKKYNYKYIYCLADASFENHLEPNSELYQYSQDFVKNMQDNLIHIESYIGTGMSIIEQLQISHTYTQILDLPNQNDSVQLRLIGGDIFVIIFYKIPKILHISSPAMANILHFALGQMNKLAN